MFKKKRNVLFSCFLDLLGRDVDVTLKPDAIYTIHEGTYSCSFVVRSVVGWDIMGMRDYGMAT